MVWIKVAKVMSQRLYFVSMYKEDSAIWSSFTCSNRSLVAKKKVRGVKHRVQEVVYVCVCVCVRARSYSKLHCMEGGQRMFLNVSLVAQCRAS